MAQLNQELEDAIERIAIGAKQVTMSLSIRDIQRLVNAELGFVPSTSTVTRVLRRLDIDNGGDGRHRWAWKWKHNNGEKGE